MLNIFDKGKHLTNFMKVLSAIIAIVFNVVYLILNGRIASIEEQKSLIMFCVFLVAIFAPVDIALIIRTIIKNKLGDNNE